MAKNVLLGTVRSIIKSWVNCQNQTPWFEAKILILKNCSSSYVGLSRKKFFEIECKNERFTGDFFRSGSSFCKLARRISLGLKIDRWGTLGLLHLRDSPIFSVEPFVHS